MEREREKYKKTKDNSNVELTLRRLPYILSKRRPLGDELIDTSPSLYKFANLPQREGGVVLDILNILKQ